MRRPRCSEGGLRWKRGNIPFALRFLAEQVKSSPEDAELREVYAGALYLAERWPDAKQQLSVAANLGAPAWRLAYHRGGRQEISEVRSSITKRCSVLLR